MVTIRTLRQNIQTVRDKLGDVEKLGLGKFPHGAPPGTVPVGDGWYRTPDTPADPQDCARYPDSPWCGGNPLDTKPIGYDVDAQVHGCGFDLELGGTVGFIKMPPQRLSYRFEGECRKEPPPPDPPPPPKPGEFHYSAPSCDDNAIVYAFCVDDYSLRRETSNTDREDCLKKYGAQAFTYMEDYWARWESSICPGRQGAPVSGVYTSGSGSNGYDLDYFSCIIKPLPYYSSPTQTNTDDFTNRNYRETYGIDVNGRIGYIKYDNTSHPYTLVDGTVVVAGEITYCRTSFQNAYIMYGKWQLVNKYLSIGGAGANVIINRHVDLVVKEDCSNAKLDPPSPYRKNPPPDNWKPPKDECDCMACCPDNTSLLQQLLAEIRKANKAIGSDSFPVSATIFDEDENKQQAQSKNLKLSNIAQSITKIIDRNEKLSKIIGIDAFPLELPESVIIHPESNIFKKALDFLNPFKSTKIYSVMDLLVWKIKQDSAVLGQWGQVIEVQSTEKKKVMVDGKEIEKDVEKTEEIVLPNISQTMKEQILLQSQQMKTMGIALDCIVKLLIDVAQSKAISAETVRRVEDIQQYLDYPTNEKTVDVPVQITFPNPKDPKDVQNDIFKLLQEGKITITYDDWTGEHSQDEKLLDLLQAAKTIQGVYFSKS